MSNRLDLPRTFNFTRTLILFGVVSIGVSNVWAASKEEAPCAVLIKAENGFQVTSKSGQMVTTFKGDEVPIECGAIVSTHQGTAWIKTKTQVTMKFGPETYFEFNKSDKDTDYYTLYRGRMLLQSPPQKRSTVIFTTQAQVNFTGGVSWVEYQDTVKVTQVASFNKSITIQNRFNDKASQIVRVGEMSELDFSDPRVVPKQPYVMDAVVVNRALASLKLKEAERTELVQVVERVYDDRSKSLDSELESWKDIEKPQEEGRSLASETKKDEKPSLRESLETIQEREAAYVMEQFKKRVFSGVEEEQAASRVPASAAPVAPHARVKEKIVDSELKEEQKKQNEEKKKVLKHLSDSEE